MEFVKMHGLGNDFIITKASSFEEAAEFQPFARFLCNRNFGIGGDGLVIIGKDNKADIFMRIFNSDGSEAEMCGNAIRCVARLAYEEKMGREKISVRTLAGLRYPEIVFDKEGRVDAVKVDMGEPMLERKFIPMTGEGSAVGVEADISSGAIKFTAVSMGNPHCIVFVDNINDVPIEDWGRELENHPLFPQKTNVEFVQILNKNEVIMRVWERGAGITLACGTGACATTVAGVLNNKTERQVTVHLLGGDLYIEWNEEDNHVYMTGGAVEVFRGKIDLNKISLMEAR
ncbi:diaminopimelate epimerase [Thermosyntropha sp.]|uniref:diaminopimelate epimerase n=1 Tax=Thermosyntropha sp. TaxID=2740820 RepID=UPI0026013D77|nr:diaminopimelate epimerase [Thermosyntropha sp.]MBO8158528.1 diaminopimelate epimerase [Thermosyntropha sp.]